MEDSGSVWQADAPPVPLAQTGGMDNGAAVTVRDLRKSYRDVTAVDGIDLDIGHGEVFALLGPNGAGKTTTVEILEGFRPRDGGKATVLGQDPAHGSRAWRARIGIVLQLASTGPELTVLEMVRHFASFYPTSRPPEEVIDLVGLTEKARSRISKLSGGQTRRLDVALGIVGQPELLFLDEPTTGFDPEARRQFWDLGARAHRAGTRHLASGRIGAMREDVPLAVPELGCCVPRRGQARSSACPTAPRRSLPRSSAACSRLPAVDRSAKGRR